jgi:micrococcal nuclease
VSKDYPLTYQINYYLMKHKPYCYKATCTSVYDGDTVTLDIQLGFNITMHKQKIRLLGINTPEVRGSERADGLVSRDRLRELIEGKEVIIATHKDKGGKYGRLLATIYLDGVDINQQLVDEGLAEVY